MLAFANDFSTLNCTFINIHEIIPIFSSDIFLLSSIVPIKIYSNADTMKLDIIKENYKKVGIYRWINNENNYTYVGSSINLSNRLRLYYNFDFISSLQDGPLAGPDKNNNKSMIHDALVKYGYSKFTLEILEYCDASSVLEREQYYLDTLNPKYNILKIAGSLTGFKHSDESILKRVSTFSDNQKIKKALKTIESDEGLIEDKPLINFPLKGSSRLFNTLFFKRLP